MLDRMLALVNAVCCFCCLALIGPRTPVVSRFVQGLLSFVVLCRACVRCSSSTCSLANKPKSTKQYKRRRSKAILQASSKNGIKTKAGSPADDAPNKHFLTITTSYPPPGWPKTKIEISPHQWFATYTSVVHCPFRPAPLSQYACFQSSVSSEMRYSAIKNG